MSHEYFNPVRSVYGAGALSSLPDLLAGRRALLVTFPEARALGLVGRIETLLGDRLAGVIDDVRPNPDVAELKALYEGFWRRSDQGGGVDVIVAIGGGSAIDTAKALMVGT
ncbi:MAG TPA: iron-containing alcohol dehydrogenase, partial [Burkholderiaceae bacterium]|nr:iron-containing alcohol dehydrogenase [Burkholderiaceae bacterium]